MLLGTSAMDATPRGRRSVPPRSPCARATWASAARPVTRSFAWMRARCHSTVRMLRCTCSAISRFVWPSASSASTSRSRRLSLSGAGRSVGGDGARRSPRPSATMSATAWSARFSGAAVGPAPSAAQRDQLADDASARPHRRDQLVRQLEARDVRAELGAPARAEPGRDERAQQRGAGLVGVGDGDRLQGTAAVVEQARRRTRPRSARRPRRRPGCERRSAGGESDATSSSSPVRSAPSSGSGEKPRALAGSEIK